MRGHARRGVHLQQEGLAVAGADHQVGAAPAAAAERAVGLQRERWISRSSSRGQPARAQVLRVVGEVLVLVVVVAFGRDDADHRQRQRELGTVAEHRAGDLVAFDELLAQHVGIVLRGQLVRPRRTARCPRPWSRRSTSLRAAASRSAAARARRARRTRSRSRRRWPARHSRGVGRPSARQRRLVMTLSIAIALAITPEPV